MSAVSPQGTRLITHNLLHSAAGVQGRAIVSAKGLADLCQLIDVYCLCDQAVLLGSEMMPELARADSALVRLLYDSKFVVPADTHREREITFAARRHLLAYLGEDAGADYDSILLKALHVSCHRLYRFAEHLSYGVGYDTQSNYPHGPDGSQDFEVGLELFRLGGDKARLLELVTDPYSRSFNFFLRSFVYLGFSDVSGLVFVPDSTRVPVIGKLVESEQDLRAKLLGAMKNGWQRRPSSMARQVSPLAAIVFERAKPNAERIPQEMAILREELQSLRTRLGKAEHVLDEGKGDDVAEAMNDWNLVVSEIHASFGLEPTLVNLEKILSFGSAIGEVKDEPTSSKSWIGFLLGLPFDVVRRVIARGPAIELHHIRKDLPASGRLRKAAEELFGGDAFF